MASVKGDDGTSGLSPGLGRSFAVWGDSQEGIGVIGTSSAFAGAGVIGVAGEGDFPDEQGGNRGGVVGKVTGGTGVVGRGNVGVLGDSTSGYGGAFSISIGPGNREPLAQLRLVPSMSQGPPTSGTHNAGEFYVDSNGVLYFCTAMGTPGTWKRVQLV